ncbi:9415_t:CDS:2 [Paraglomus brasilianum]|uniref:9415_t:CDS:1 n=1 Tax=Paraglomus brasilianum TaxID=144538 RepID=A0A9N9EX73_9GLOM|nr:9415_t:CDS:2 [Paraglomus brasilianum]
MFNAASRLITALGLREETGDDGSAKQKQNDDEQSSKEIIPNVSIITPDDHSGSSDNPPTQFPLLGSPQRIRSPLTPLQKATKQRRKVALEPGHSALDWARLKSSGVDLTEGARGMKKITMEEVQRHRTKADAWTVLGGKVYNITPYLKFHPGGVGEIMRCAGRDGTVLFMEIHSWVNYELMLDKCLIGYLLGDSARLLT